MNHKFAMFISIMAVGLMAFLLTGQTVSAKAIPITVSIEGKKVQFGDEPIQESGVTLVPFRAFFEALSLKVKWDEVTKTVVGSAKELKITLQIGKQEGMINEKPYSLAIAPKLINHKLYIPLRFVGQATGRLVEWVPATSTIRIGASKKDPKTANSSQTSGTSGTSEPVAKSNIPQSPDSSKTFSIEGRILDTDGKPAPGVRVYASYLNGVQKDYQVLSDDTGFYKIEGLDKKTSYMIHAMESYGEYMIRPDSLTITYEKESRIIAPDIRFNKAQMIGKVFDENGNPAEGLPIQLAIVKRLPDGSETHEFANYPYEIMTRADGTFIIGHLQNGAKYHVGFALPASYDYLGYTFTYSDQDAITPIEFKLNKMDVLIEVEGPDGNLIRDDQVYVSIKSLNNKNGIHSGAFEVGYYYYEGLFQGEPYMIKAYPREGYSKYKASIPVTFTYDTASAVQRIKLQYGVDMPVQAIGKIVNGLNQPVSGTSVFFVDLDQQGKSGATGTNSTGVYALRGLIEGHRYRVYPFTDSADPKYVNASGYEFTYSPEMKDLPDLRILEAQAWGKVVSSEGELMNATATVTDENGIIISQSTGSLTGTYKVGGMEAGKRYTIAITSASLPEWDSMAKENLRYKNSVALPDPITVTYQLGLTIPDMIIYNKNTLVTGKLTDAGGKPLANAELYCFFKKKGVYLYTLTNEMGEYRFMVDVGVPFNVGEYDYDKKEFVSKFDFMKTTNYKFALPDLVIEK